MKIILAQDKEFFLAQVAIAQQELRENGDNGIAESVGDASNWWDAGVACLTGQSPQGTLPYPAHIARHEAENIIGGIADLPNWVAARWFADLAIKNRASPVHVVIIPDPWELVK